MLLTAVLSVTDAVSLFHYLKWLTINILAARPSCHRHQVCALVIGHQQCSTSLVYPGSRETDCTCTTFHRNPVFRIIVIWGMVTCGWGLGLWAAKVESATCNTQLRGYQGIVSSRELLGGHLATVAKWNNSACCFLHIIILERGSHSLSQLGVPHTSIWCKQKDWPMEINNFVVWMGGYSGMMKP